AVPDVRVDGPGQVDEEALVVLELVVALDCDADGLARLARGERQAPGGSDVVVAGLGRVVRGAVIDGHCRGSGFRQGVRDAGAARSGNTRGVLNWASDPVVGKLPSTFANPLTKRAIPPKPPKNPLRDEVITLDERVRLVEQMDRWQLCQLGWFMVLPLRPDEG